MRRCAICGSKPELTSSDMGRPNGRGYPGHTDYRLKCPDCGMLSACADDIYDDSRDEKAPQRVITNWNEQVLKIEAHLRWREEKEKINPFVRDLLIAYIKGEIDSVGPLTEKLIKEVEKL